MSSPRITLILARAKNGVIGDRGALPWRIPDDMRRFREITMGKPVIMGRKTWESLPKRPLPGRVNIVVTRSEDYEAEAAQLVHSFDEALAAAGSAAEVMVIGGAEIYRLALPRADRIELTEIDAEPAGDVAMDKFSPTDWMEESRQDGRTPEGLGYAYVTLTRRQAPART